MDREVNILESMIKIYCRDLHKCKEGLCEDCMELLEYSKERLQKCPFGKEKPPCSKCKIHCYKSNMRDNIKEVMKYAGPRMILKHPIATAIHYIKVFKNACFI